MRGDAFVRAEDNAASIDNHEFGDGFLRADGPGAWVVEIKQFARQGELHHVFVRHGLRLVEHGKDLGAGIHAVNDFGLDGQDAPNVLANVRRLIVQHFGEHRFASGAVSQAEVAALRFHGRRVAVCGAVSKSASLSIGLMGKFWKCWISIRQRARFRTSARTYD